MLTRNVGGGWGGRAQRVVDEHIYIQFKQFTVKQSRSTLNISTGPRAVLIYFLITEKETCTEATLTSFIHVSPGMM